MSKPPPSPIVWVGQCQHPRSRKEGRCEAQAVEVVDIPEDYRPKRRHAASPDVERPKAALCRAHLALVRAHKAGVTINAGSHEALCAVCLHPNHKKVCDLWVKWYFNSNEAATELGVSRNTFINHVEYFGLTEEKQKRDNTRRALQQFAEKGLAAGGHTPATGIAALKALAKERGDAETHNVNINAVLGVADFTKMSDVELAEFGRQLVAAIEHGNQPRLPPPSQDMDVVDVEEVEEALLEDN